MSSPLHQRAEKVPAGADVLVEIAIRNVGEKLFELPQHRVNIYDYYPRTSFSPPAQRFAALRA